MILRAAELEYAHDSINLVRAAFIAGSRGRRSASNSSGMPRMDVMGRML
jgi:hypothetical protein